jgi:hypothetical protein
MKTFKEFQDYIFEKNVPTSPEKWAAAKSAAKSKFAVYPSAYANGWASKKYKSMGGGWKSVSEDFEQSIMEDLKELFDIIEEVVEFVAERHGMDSELLWEELEKISDEELIEASAAWQRSSGKDPEGGLNRKGIASYRAEHPGSKLSMAVTTKPSKLKKGSKAANRRKSFCARMGGMKKRLTSAKTAHDPDSRINKALRKWNC